MNPRSEPPSSDRPDPDRPVTHAPMTDRPESDRPDPDRPESDRPHPNRPESDRANFDRPSSDRTSFDRPSSDRSSFNHPESDRASFNRPGSDRASFNLPESDRPVAHTPVAHTPVAHPTHPDRPSPEAPESPSPRSALAIAVLTVSDRRSLADDRAGGYLVEQLQRQGHPLADRALVPDDRYQIRAIVSQWIANPQIPVILTTGGTGITGRDITPEAIAVLLDKELPGFGERLRWISHGEIGLAALQSRALAGVANGTYIFCLPGSLGACRTAWEQILAPQLAPPTAAHPCNFAHLLDRLKE